MSLQKNRVVSRSIVCDPVYDKIKLNRYEHHQQSLQRIAHAKSDLQFSRNPLDYLFQIQKYKRSSSYVKGLLDTRNSNNRILVKRMVDIDGRKNLYEPDGKKLPEIVSRIKKEVEIRKQNQKIVERILKQRSTRSKEQIMKQSEVYEKYKRNLRKIKDKKDHRLYPLKIIR